MSSVPSVAPTPGGVGPYFNFRKFFEDSKFRKFAPPADTAPVTKKRARPVEELHLALDKMMRLDELVALEPEELAQLDKRLQKARFQLEVFK